MSIVTSAHLIDAVRNARVLPPQQLEVAGSLAPRFPQPKALAKELIERGWLTVYQVNNLFRGHGKDLVLGSYVLLERIGEGSMGLVYKARHMTLGRVAALKVIRRERLSHVNAVRRFQREIRAIAQLSHPNVVIAYDADQINGTHFIAMEYVDGKDLQRIVKEKGPLAIPAACNYIRQAALCLQYLHERGLVHRDIMPSNLLLTSDGALIKVLDLGLARLSEAEADSVQLTQQGFVVGTADFIAPEQACDSHAADIRSDLYSLGCTFYFILTGQVPFPGKTLKQKLMAHQMEPPPDVELKRREAPAAVSVVIRRLMAKNPDERYQVPADLAYDLAYILTTGGLPDRSRGMRGTPAK
jgi:serine/threonine protein kinase